MTHRSGPGGHARAAPAALSASSVTARAGRRAAARRVSASIWRRGGAGAATSAKRTPAAPLQASAGSSPIARALGDDRLEEERVVGPVRDLRPKAGAAACLLESRRELGARDPRDPALTGERLERDRRAPPVAAREDEQERLAHQQRCLQTARRRPARPPRSALTRAGRARPSGAAGCRPRARARERCRRAPGARRASCAAAGTTSPAAALGKAPITISPRTASCSAASSASAASSSASARSVRVDERVSGGRETHAPAIALQQRRVRLALELGQRLRDRRRGVAHDAGDLGDRAAPRQLAEQTQPS